MDKVGDIQPPKWLYLFCGRRRLVVDGTSKMIHR